MKQKFSHNIIQIVTINLFIHYGANDRPYSRDGLKNV